MFSRSFIFYKIIRSFLVVLSCLGVYFYAAKVKAEVNNGGEIKSEKTSSGQDSKSSVKGFKSEDEDGSYYYDEEDDDSSTDVGEAVEVKPNPENYQHGLKSVMSDGSYLYKVEQSEHHNGASVRMGQFAPPSIKVKLTDANNNEIDLSYSDMYSSKPLNTFLFDYSWDKEKWGVWSIVVGTGIAQATAPGRFKRNPLGDPAIEKYTFYIIPNHLSFLYKFQYTRRPWAVPFITGGYCPFGLAETRDDGATKKIISAQAITAAAGIKFNITAFDSQSAFNLDAEYGIGNVWLDVEARIYQGLQKNQQRDVSSNVLNAGIGFDF